MQKKIIYLFLVSVISACKSAHLTRKADIGSNQYVNPFIGTAFTGHTFPGACYPLGMIQAGPQTGNFNWDYCAGYVYTDSIIEGFSQNRLNGTGVPDLGDLLVQPFSGSIRENVTSRYHKESEQTFPGYYGVKLVDNKVDVRITASPHVAFHSYQFEKNETPNLLIDFQSGQVSYKERFNTRVLEHEITFDNDVTISGYTKCKGWVERVYYFVIEFDKPIQQKQQLDKRDVRENASRYIISFEGHEENVLNMKIAMSSVSVENAKKNMNSEISDWNFDNVRQSAEIEWGKYLSKVIVEGSEDQKASFYSSLYRLYIQPNNIADVDGSYVGPNKKRSQSSSGKFYSTWSQWDIFRAAFPLHTILTPELIPDFVNSMLDYSEQQGHLPVWSLWGQETYTMIANHSVPMIVDAYLKGFGGFDEQRAYNEVKKSLTVSHRKSDWSVYDQYGYYPFDSVRVESVSSTLESGYNDYNAALMAKKMGKDNDYQFFSRRADFYKNIFDPETKYMRGRDTKGNWRNPFDPFKLAHAQEHGGDYTEGNAAQYSWHVLHDIPGLIDLMGGKKAAEERLDYFFSATHESSRAVLDVTGLIGQYAHGNEPSHHIVYLYNYVDKPKKAQELIHKICRDFYKNKPDGLIGNEDCGQMSAWYIFSALGFYPVDPVSGEFVFGAPQIPFARINISEDKTFTVRAVNLSEDNIFVDRIEWNGKPYNRKYIDYKSIMSGGELTFYMTNEKQDSSYGI